VPSAFSLPFSSPGLGRLRKVYDPMSAGGLALSGIFHNRTDIEAELGSASLAVPPDFLNYLVLIHHLLL
jgi:hypothetical protein